MTNEDRKTVTVDSDLMGYAVDVARALKEAKLAMLRTGYGYYSISRVEIKFDGTEDCGLAVVPSEHTEDSFDIEVEGF